MNNSIVTNFLFEKKNTCRNSFTEQKGGISIHYNK